MLEWRRDKIVLIVLCSSLEACGGMNDTTCIQDNCGWAVANQTFNSTVVANPMENSDCLSFDA